MNQKPRIGKDTVTLDHLRDADYSPYRFFTAAEWAQWKKLYANIVKYAGHGL